MRSTPARYPTASPMTGKSSSSLGCAPGLGKTTR